jgi:hypothetical protein
MPLDELTDPLLWNAAATLYMTGVIWFVQIVHYPLMARVGRSGFVAYERLHTRWTTWVVAPPMLVEAGTAVLLALNPGRIPAWQAWNGLGLVLGIWLSTAVLQVPQHRKLEAGFDGRAHAHLVRTNWIRVALWTARALFVLHWLARSASI